jgi:CheY-like chemotaxis protein
VRALVLAGDPVRRAALGRALESIGLQVELLADAERARRRLAASLPDLAVLDGHGSQLPLFEVYLSLRGEPAGAPIPVIFAHFTEEGVVHDGPDHYLPTDSAPELVATTARELLGIADVDHHTAGDEAAPAEPSTGARDEPRRRRAGRVLEVVLLALGIVLLFIGGALVLLQRETLPPLIVPPTVAPASPAPKSSPEALFGVLPPVGGLAVSPSPSPQPR